MMTMTVRPPRTKNVENTTSTANTTSVIHPPNPPRTMMESSNNINTSNGLVLFWHGLVDHVLHHPHPHNNNDNNNHNHHGNNIHHQKSRSRKQPAAPKAVLQQGDNVPSNTDYDNNEGNKDDSIKIIKPSSSSCSSASSASSSSSASSLSKTIMISSEADSNNNNNDNNDNNGNNINHDDHSVSYCHPHPQHQQHEEADAEAEAETLPLPLPLFEPSEIAIGELLGKGSFCHVYELDGLNLLSSTPTTTTTTTTGCSSSNLLQPSNRSRRRLYNSIHNIDAFSSNSNIITRSSSKEQYDNQQQQHVQEGRTTTSSSTSRYVVKKLRPNLREERGRKIFCHAACDIREEFELLSMIDHPNIVKVCGGYREKMCECDGDSSSPSSSSSSGFGTDHHRNYHNSNNNNNINMNNKNGDSFLSLLASRNRSKTPSSTSALLPLKDPFFMILERLDKTLTQQIEEWKKSRKGESSTSSISSITTTSIVDGAVVVDNSSRNNERITRHALYTTKLRYAHDVANALAWMHSHRLIYRDLKPDNVGIAADGTVKIFDFGLARPLPPVEKAIKSYHHNGRRELMFRMSGVGTRRYMSPECIVGHIYNQSVDCYSWAMVFYEMLSLQKPFASYNREVHRVVVCEHQERPCLESTDENIPRDAQLLLHRAWAQDPSDRPTMDELCRDYLRPMIDRAERLSLTPAQRGSAAIMEMSQILGGLEDFSVSKSSPQPSSAMPNTWLLSLKTLCSSQSGDNRRKSRHRHHSHQHQISRKSSSSTADMTVTTTALTTASSSDFVQNDAIAFNFAASLGAPAGILAIPGGISSCWSAADI